MNIIKKGNKIMQKLINNPYFHLIVRLALGGLFIIVGMGKIADPKLFAREIGNYDLLPVYLINLFALTLPWVEVAAGIFILAGVRVKTNSIIAGGLLVVFIIAVSTAWARGLNINCGCFASMAEEKVGLWKILQNAGWLLLAIALIYSKNRKFTLENLSLKDK